MTINLSEIPVRDKQYWLQSLVAPRPIALVSTMDNKGRVNLAPFSFFNLFSAEPPVVIFSTCRSVRTGEHKDTLLNLLEVPECIISIIDDSILDQVNMTSITVDRGVNEFELSGLSQLNAQVVRPPKVKEAKAHLECAVMEIKVLGNKGGAGNLVICEVLQMDICDTLLDNHGRFEASRVTQVGRMSEDKYVRTVQSNCLTVPKPGFQPRDK